MSTYTEQFNLVVKSINYYNDILLNPDKMVWGTMTKEEADDAFNDINNDLHDDWGTKSSEMLVWIREEEEILCGGCGKNDMRNYYKFPFPEDRCSDCEEEEPRMNCVDCDYSLSEGEFNSGKGRIMFNDVNDDGTKYRCGCCDDRVADPQGMFPDEEEEEEEPYCFKDTTIDTVENDICFCSVGGCVKPTEFDYRFE